MAASGSQGKYNEVDALYRRAIRIEENAFGADHPGVARTVANRAMALHASGSLMHRATQVENNLPGDLSICAHWFEWLLHWCRVAVDDNLLHCLTSNDEVIGSSA